MVFLNMRKINFEARFEQISLRVFQNHKLLYIFSSLEKVTAENKNRSIWRIKQISVDLQGRRECKCGSRRRCLAGKGCPPSITPIRTMFILKKRCAENCKTPKVFLQNCDCQRSPELPHSAGEAKSSI